jgi:spore coat polysaccharide biosynthesis protein SpsF
MKQYKTDQEAFWAGAFGQEYIQRNQGNEQLASNLRFFSNALRSAHEFKSILEFGANVGMNLKALKLLFPQVDFNAIEINKSAAEELQEIIPQSNIYNESILEFNPEGTCDLTLIKGVLIHINPEVLGVVYDKLVASTNRYLLVADIIIQLLFLYLTEDIRNDCLNVILQEKSWTSIRV